jgi:DNA polymerase III sliding clamp (beta) subunit (PCNA family)
MRFAIKNSIFKHAVNDAKQLAIDRSESSVYAGIMLIVKGGRLSVLGSDSNTTLATSVIVDDPVDGEVVIAARPLYALLSHCEDSADILVSASDTELKVDSPELSTPYTFRAMQAKFPRPPAAVKPPNTVDFTKIGKAVAAIRSAVDFEHGGVQLVSDETTLSIFATNSYQLHSCEIENAGFGSFSGVVSLDVLEQLQRHKITSVTTDESDRNIRFSGPNTLLSTRLLSVATPDVQSILKNLPAHHCLVNIADLRRKLDRLAAISTASESLTLTVGDNKIVLGAADDSLGAGSEVIETVTSAEESFVLSPTYLKSMLAAHSADNVTLRYQGDFHPLFITSEDPLVVVTAVAVMKS